MDLMFTLEIVFPNLLELTSQQSQAISVTDTWNEKKLTL